EDQLGRAFAHAPEPPQVERGAVPPAVNAELLGAVVERIDHRVYLDASHAFGVSAAIPATTVSRVARYRALAGPIPRSFGAVRARRDARRACFSACARRDARRVCFSTFGRPAAEKEQRGEQATSETHVHADRIITLVHVDQREGSSSQGVSGSRA